MVVMLSIANLFKNNNKNAFIDNQVLVLEVWSRGGTSFEDEESDKDYSKR